MSVRRQLFRAHQAVGVVAGLVLVLSAVTGMLLVFREALGPGPPPQAPVVAQPLSLEALIATAQAAGPGDAVTDIGLPSAPDRPYVFYLDDDDETEVYLAGDGQVLGQRPTVGLTRTLFRLHTGEIFGSPGKVVNVAAGTALVVLVVTGGWMIAARRRRTGS